MKPKKRIKQLETQVSELKAQVQSNSITLVDECNPDCKVTLSLKNGEFLVQKVSTTSTNQIDIIIKDHK